MGRRQPGGNRRQPRRRVVHRDCRARPACAGPRRLLSGACRRHRLPAESRRRLAPHVPRHRRPLAHRSPDKIETSRYYDVVNFARRVKVPGFYSWGFNDETCPPTSMYSAYNVIPGMKTLLLALETGHNNVPEQVAEVNEWLQEFLKTGSTKN
ncbi:MAG: acetylxylan esterase [Acidobacteriota bacterium]